MKLSPKLILEIVELVVGFTSIMWGILNLAISYNQYGILGRILGVFQVIVGVAIIGAFVIMKLKRR